MAEIPRELLAAPVPAGAMRTLVGLWSYANPNEDSPFVWPSQRTVAAITGQPERTVRSHVPALVAAGLLSREWRGRWGYVLSREPSGSRAPDRQPVAILRSGSELPDRQPRPSGSRAPDRQPVAGQTGSQLPQNTPGTPQFGGDAPPCSAQRDLGGEFVLEVQAPPDPVADLHAWFERALVERKKRRSPQGLSPKARRGIEALLKHIEATLRCDRATAIASQRAHLESRLAELDRGDPEVALRIGKQTAWRTGWWDFWNGKSDDLDWDAPDWTPEDTQVEGVF